MTTNNTDAPTRVPPSGYSHAEASRRLCETFRCAASPRVRVQNVSLGELLAVLEGPAEDGAEGWAKGAGASWVVTTKRGHGQAKSSTALSTDGKRALRAQHEHGAVTVLRGVARASGGRVVFVKPTARLDRSDLMRARGIQLGPKGYTLQLEAAGQSNAERRLAELAQERAAMEADAQLRRAAFSAMVTEIAALPPDERKARLADADEGLRLAVTGAVHNAKITA